MNDALSEENILKSVLYRDALILIINKPRGIAVHPGTGKGESLDKALDYLTFGLPQRPQLAHRLDAATSGCLILGRHRQALIRLGQLFSKNLIKKTYWAVVEGTPKETEGRIDFPLSKQSPDKNRWWMKTDPQGKEAITDYRVLYSGEGLSLLELMPLTGRTHQLRVHCSAMGWPIVGDRIYGQKDTDVFLHLHARTIEIPLYPKKENVCVTAPLPEHMIQTLEKMGVNPQ